MEDQVQEVPIWSREETIEFINKTRDEIRMHVNQEYLQK